MRKIFLLFLITFLSSSLFAATFVVTSNADSGPGTLRQALLDAAANGSAEKDYINFNLPDLSEAGRTITLTAQLPDVTGNVIIDGTTQPGNKFGVSDAKIKITLKFTTPNNLSVFYSNGADILEIYGFWFDCDYTSWGGSAVNFNKFVSITIGFPGKGNLFERGNIGINNGKKCIFQNNISGIDVTGEAGRGGDMTIKECTDVTIGGSATTGNAMAGSTNLYFSDPTLNTLNISYNKMGTNVSGTKAPYGFNLINASRLTISGPYMNNGQPANVPVNSLIKNNIIADVYGATLLQYGPVGGKVNIEGNAFNTDFTGTANFNQFSQSIAFYAISVSGSADVIIGGDDISKRNLIAYCQDGIGYGSEGKYTISRNSIFCVGEISFVGQDKLPQVKINQIDGDKITGTATPLSDVELFNADCSCTIPTPKDYFATVKADANGNWLYNGSFAGYLMASATFNNLTGYFAGISIDDSKVKIQNYYCDDAKGSITGISTQAATNAKWYNSAGVLVGSNIDLIGVLAGVYTLKINEGSPCELKKSFTVRDFSVKVDVSKIKLQKPSCQGQGAIRGIITSSLSDQVKYNWVSESGQIMCDCVDFNPITPGIYTFVVTNGNGACSKQYFGPYDMNMIGAANIDQSTANTTPTTCNQSTGSITNITVTGTGTLKYAWMDASGKTVSTTKDLTNQPGGIYTLQVTDDTQCGPIYSTAITIPELNGITLDDAQKVITQATCQFNNGSIANIKTTGATDFKWYNSINPNVVVATTADLTNAPAGNYYLVASNAGGCSKQSPVYAITQQATFTTAGISKILKNATCGQNNGRIEVIFLPVVPGNVVSTVVSYRWVNHATGQTIPGVTGPVLDNIDAGSYDIYGTNDTGCERFLITYSIGRTAGVTINSAGLKVVNDACATGKGSIKGITVSGSSLLTYLWADANGKPVGNNADLVNLKAGSYTLTVTATDLNCVQTYGPVNVTDVSAAQIDQSTAIMKPATCGQSNGSITGITVTGTGTIKYQWRDALGNPVGTNKDLTGQRAAVYFLQVTDDSACGPVSSTYIAITETNGITIDDSQKIIGQATCQADDGSITNIKTTGATIFKWFNSANTVVAYTADLTNAPTGSYYLQASNALGCIKQSAVYVITRDAGPNLGGLSKVLKNASCGLNNGSIEVLFQNLPAGAVTGYRWVNHATGAVVKNTTVPILTDIDAGTYDIYVTGNTACERFLISYTIGRNPDMDVNTTNAKITDDACQANTGSITGIGITGRSPLSYYWTDDKGGVVSNTVDLKNVKAGTYLLNIKDGSACQQGVVFIIKSTTLVLTAPVVKEIQLCTAGDAIITLPGLTAGYGYRLYNSLTDAQPIDVGTTDKFKVKALQSRSYYVSLYSGNCESARAEVKISVGISLQNLVNTFSPNGDGINDLWKIPGIENYPGAIVKIFTRNGDLVFSSIGYETAFDGNYKGKPLPSGSYYYIINLNSGCTLLSGNLTIIR